MENNSLRWISQWVRQSVSQIWEHEKCIYSSGISKTMKTKQFCGGIITICNFILNSDFVLPLQQLLKKTNIERYFRKIFIKNQNWQNREQQKVWQIDWFAFRFDVISRSSECYLILISFYFHKTLAGNSSIKKMKWIIVLVWG